MSVACLFTPSWAPNSTQHMADVQRTLVQMMLGRQVETDHGSEKEGSRLGNARRDQK